MYNLFTSDTEKQIQDIQNQHKGKRIGLTFSCFDLLHMGHLLMLKDAKSRCDILVVGLQTDPTIDRKHKNKPIQTFEERELMVRSIRYIDKVIVYATKSDCYNILKTLNPDVRILGTDWLGKEYTGCELDIPIHWHQRTHNYSTTDLRKRVFEAEKKKTIKVELRYNVESYCLFIKE